MLDMNVGFRVLPVDPDTKAPLPWLTPHGVKDATDDPITLRQWMALASDSGLGLVPGSGFAVLDDDTGDLHAAIYGLAGTWSERTRRGMHYWTRLPSGRQLRKSRLLGATGDLITGDSAYAVISPTPPYMPIDPDAPILTLPDDSPLWEFEAPRVMLATSTARITAADREAAHAEVKRMRASSDTDRVSRRCSPMIPTGRAISRLRRMLRRADEISRSPWLPCIAYEITSAPPQFYSLS